MTERTPIIAANWKMHHDHFVAIQFTQKLSYLLDKKDTDGVDVVLCPPFTDLRSVQTTIDSDRIPVSLGAQHCHFEEQGAFTGEVSPAMLAKLTVKYVIVGHSERREIFGETNEMVNAKLKAIWKFNMTPILCVGRNPRRARVRRDRREGPSPDCGRLRRGRQGTNRAHRGGLRTDLGDRYRSERNARRCRSHHRCRA